MVSAYTCARAGARARARPAPRRGLLRRSAPRSPPMRGLPVLVLPLLLSATQADATCGASVPQCLRGNDSIYGFGFEDPESHSVAACCAAAQAWAPRAQGWQLATRVPATHGPECSIFAYFVPTNRTGLNCTSGALEAKAAAEEQRPKQAQDQRYHQEQSALPVTVTCTNTTDCTDELQAAIDTCARTIKVPSLPNGRSWVVRPIEATCDGQTIDFSDGAVLQAKRHEFHKRGGGMVLFRIQNRSDVTVLGHGGAIFRMWREDYGNPSLYNHSEGRHGIAIYGSRNILLDGLTVTETGGDGVYISNILGQVGTPNRNITIVGCNLTANYRNAMSVISVDGLRVQRTILSLSKGTPPQGGIDFEPNSPVNLLRDILLDDITLFGNTQRSITLSAHALRASADNASATSFAPISIVIRNTRILSGGSFGISINTSPRGVPPGSSLELQRVFVTHTAGAGLLLEDKHVNLLTTVSDSIFESVATGGQHPVWIEGRNAPCEGSSFHNVTVVDQLKRPAVVFMADVEQMTGEIDVINRHCINQTVPVGNSLVIACVQPDSDS